METHNEAPAPDDQTAMTLIAAMAEYIGIPTFETQNEIVCEYLRDL